MAMPTLRQLQFLAALGEKGSFSRAAEACHVTQPTLSAAIKELEDLLGVQLVEREARGARLTRAGESAVRRARVILSEAKELVCSVSPAGGLLEGPFHLGAIPTIAPFVFAQTVSALNGAYPNAKVFLQEDKTARLLDGLRDHSLDAAIIALPWKTDGIAALQVFDDEFLLAAPAQHPLARNDDLVPEDLRGEELLLLEDGHCLRDHALSVCTQATGSLGAQVAATSLTTLVNMVAGGLGVSLLPRLAVENGLHIESAVTLRRFAVPVVGRSIGVAWRAGSGRAGSGRASSGREAEARVIAGVLRRIFAP